MIKFNIASDNYLTFIQKVQEWARDPKRFSHGCYVLPLPPKGTQKPEFYDLELVAKDAEKVDRTTIVKICRHDLYIIGYKMEGAANWLEFEWKRPKDTKEPIHLIPNSKSLGFAGNYESLGTLKNLKKVGYTVLRDAISELATTKDSKTRKESLRALIVMVSEAARSQKLLDVLVPAMQKMVNIEFQQSWMPELITSWGNLSDMLLREDAYAIGFRLPKDTYGNPNILSTIPELKIITAADAAKCCKVLKGNYTTQKPPLLFAANTSASIVGKGYPLVEIFSVHMNNIVSGEIYGTIELDDGLGTFPVYNQQRDKSELIQPNGIATLTGPYRGISISQSFQVSLDLKNKGTSPSMDVEVSKGSFSWNICELFNIKYYDERMSSVVNGKSGSATVYYTPFWDAIQANVEVMLVNAIGKDPANVYGNVVGRYTSFNYSPEEKKYYQSVVFSKVGKDNVKVKPGKNIPVSRYVIAVPTNGSLILEGNLWNYNSATSSDQIAAGITEFSPEMNGKVSKDIKGKIGLVRVTVTWNGQITA